MGSSYLVSVGTPRTTDRVLDIDTPAAMASCQLSVPAQATAPGRWGLNCRGAVLPADVRQVMQLVAGHAVGHGAHAAQGPVGRRATVPGCRVQATEQRDER